MELDWLCLVLVVLWSITHLSTAAYNTDCEHVEVKDTAYQHDRNGRYEIMSRSFICNGRQSYRKEGGGNFIYYLELSDGWEGWMIGTSLCVNKGGMAVQDPAISPGDVTRNWEEVYADQWWTTNAHVPCVGPLATGDIVGIVIGVIVAIIFIGVIAFCFYKNQTKKGAVHGTGPVSRQPRQPRPAVSTISGPHRATVRPQPPPGSYGPGTYGYMGPAYPPQGHGAPPPPQGWHAQPVAPPAYSQAPPSYNPSYGGAPFPKPEDGFAAYPPNAMAPVDSGPPPSYSQSQGHQNPGFSVTGVHTGVHTAHRPPPSSNRSPSRQNTDEM